MSYVASMMSSDKNAFTSVVTEQNVCQTGSSQHHLRRAMFLNLTSQLPRSIEIDNIRQPAEFIKLTGRCIFKFDPRKEKKTMNVSSNPSVHPVEAPPMNQDAAVMGLIRMKDVQGMPGTRGGLLLRLFQFVFSLIALSLMVSIRDFAEITAFCFLVAAVSLQSLWSLSLVLVDGYCLLVGRSLRNSKVIRLLTIGDGITSTLTFAAACASAGITVLIDNDLDECHSNHCAQIETATAMAFLSWFAVSPSFLMNFWSLAAG